MPLRPLSVACPACGSENVTYTCEPTCCFNHVCGDCYCSFELFTELLGDSPGPVKKPTEKRDSLAPTVACARCQGLDVFMVEETASSSQLLVCAACQASLQLGFDSVDAR
ncbi:MAG: hypothetical protein ACREOH_01495 [Candidatus Entotheonellia bacterium]